MPENEIGETLRGLNPLNKLADKLMKSGHPYGLLLLSSPSLSAATLPDPGIAINVGPGGLSASSSVIESSSDTQPGSPAKFSRDLSIAGMSGMMVPGHSPEASLSTTASSLLSLKKEGDQGYYSSAALSSVLGLSAGADQGLAQLLRTTLENANPQIQAAFLPMLISDKEKEITQQSPERIEVNGDKLRVGSVGANINIYHGKADYVVKGAGLETPFTIKPGDKFLTIHVNQGGKEYAQMEPLARIKSIKRDFQDLCGLLQDPRSFELDDTQTQLIESLDTAPMIGVSHLVRLIASKGLPTWGLQDLPKPVQGLHTIDSQAVSKLFGGDRKVKPSDIKVMFLPASMRNLVA